MSQIIWKSLSKTVSSSIYPVPFPLCSISCRTTALSDHLQLYEVPFFGCSTGGLSLVRIRGTRYLFWLTGTSITHVLRSSPFSQTQSTLPLHSTLGSTISSSVQQSSLPHAYANNPMSIPVLQNACSRSVMNIINHVIAPLPDTYTDSASSAELSRTKIKACFILRESFFCTSEEFVKISSRLSCQRRRVPMPGCI